MGVIYKLKTEIKDFILEQKRENPLLGCRSLITLIQSKFQIYVSKSSINSVIKEAGLSMPIGRRLKKKRRKLILPLQPIPEPLKLEFKEPKIETKEPEAPAPKPEVSIIKPELPMEMPCTGAILLQAADYLIGGTYYITEVIKNQLNLPEKDLFAKTERLIYLPLFEPAKEAEKEDILLYLNNLQSVKTITQDIMRIIYQALQEVRCIKVDTLDGNTFYLDGQLHTIWSTPYVPYDFSATIYNIKSYINKYFYEDKPFVLFMAPGYDTPTKEFFNFILSLDSVEKRITKLTLYNHKFEELEIMPLRQAKRHFFVLGVWPWQFVDFRKVNKIGEFKPLYFKALKKDFYVAEIEIELSQPITLQSITLKGLALKMSLAEKTRLIILSNFSGEVKPEELAEIYLSHWPNLEEAFGDYSRKIELFTYTGSSQRFFSTESLNLGQDASLDIKTFFNQYLKALDLYVKWHFLPQGFEDKDFSTIKEQFYGLPTILKKEEGRTVVIFQPPKSFPFLKELEYACRRLNEREIIFKDAHRLWFSI